MCGIVVVLIFTGLSIVQAVSGITKVFQRSVYALIDPPISIESLRMSIRIIKAKRRMEGGKCSSGRDSVGQMEDGGLIYRRTASFPRPLGDNNSMCFGRSILVIVVQFFYLPGYFAVSVAGGLLVVGCLGY